SRCAESAADAPRHRAMPSPRLIRMGLTPLNQTISTCRAEHYWDAAHLLDLLFFFLVLSFFSRSLVDLT
ncbi:MAG: hypothetical protein WBH28_15255, partial [Fuerstiella sp.]